MARRSETSSTGTGTTASTTVPAGIANGDIALFLWTFDDPTPGARTYSTGFTELQETDQATDGQSSGVAWKRCDGTETGSFQVAGAGVGASVPWVAGCVLFSGRHATDPPVATANESDAANSSPVTATATGVTAVSGDDLCMGVAPDPNNSGGVNVWTDPASFIARINTENGFSDLYVATRDNVSAGATGNITADFTLSAGTSGWGAYLVRIPAAAAAGTKYVHIQILTGVG